MKFKLVFHPEVYKDLKDAINWYNTRQEGLGERFLTVLKQHFTRLQKSALYFAVRYDDVRCMPVKKIPYMIHYRVDKIKKKVSIEAVFCTYQDPMKWGTRK